MFRRSSTLDDRRLSGVLEQAPVKKRVFMTVIGARAWEISNSFRDVAAELYPRLASDCGVRSPPMPRTSLVSGEHWLGNDSMDRCPSMGRTLTAGTLLANDHPISFSVMMDLAAQARRSSSRCSVHSSRKITSSCNVIHTESAGSLLTTDTSRMTLDEDNYASEMSASLSVTPRQHVVKMYVGPIEQFRDELPVVTSFEQWLNYIFVFLVDPRAGEESIRDVERRVSELRRWLQNRKRYRIPPFFFVVLLHTVMVAHPPGMLTAGYAPLSPRTGESVEPQSLLKEQLEPKGPLEERSLRLIDEVEKLYGQQTQVDRISFRIDFDDKKAMLRTICEVFAHALQLRKNFGSGEAMLRDDTDEMMEPEKKSTCISRLCTLM